MTSDAVHETGSSWNDDDDGSVLVMFSTQMHPAASVDAYRSDADAMIQRVREMPGFVSMKRYSAEDGETITVVRFDSEAALERWRADPDHARVQMRGRREYYQSYWVHVARTIRRYGWSG